MNTDDEQKKGSFIKRIFSSKSKKNEKYEDNSQELDNYGEYFSNGYLDNGSNDDYSSGRNDNSNNLYNKIHNNDNIYDNFYSASTNDKDLEKEEYHDDKPNKGKKKLLIIILLLIVLGVLAWLLITMLPKKDLSDINLLVTDINLKVGENKYISYEMVNVTDVIKVTFESADTSIATVDENGNVLGISEGKTTVSLKYKTGSKDKEKICNIEVIDDGNTTEDPKNTDPKNEEPKNNPTPTIPQTPPNLTVSASTTSWTNKDVTIKASASSNAGGSVSLSYAINCSTNCNYTKTNGTITVSNNGTNTVTVIATDSKNNKQAIKSVTVKIDKEAPKVSVKNYQSKYESKTGIQVCADCSDNGSGCKESQVCKIYKETAYSQTIQVQDNAGNVGKSKSFDIIINK